ncbi:hypothetical protein AAG906_015492 [Vitis piasezkii]
MEMMENLEEWPLEIGYKVVVLRLGLPLSAPFKSMVASNGVKDNQIERLEWIQSFPWAEGS